MSKKAVHVKPKNKEGILLPYQQKWLKDTSEVKVCEKSRRIGLTWAEACDDVLTAAGRKGQDVWYIGYNKDMAYEFIQDCAFWATHFNKVASAVEEFVYNDEKKDILAYRITFASKHRITALSSRPTNLRGKQGIVVIDEAAFHDNLKELIKAAMALLMWGGKVRIISTHNGDDNEFNELIKDIRAGKKPYSLHRITLDDALKDGLYKQICKKLGRPYSKQAEEKWRQQLIDFYGDGADEELFCIPSKSGGAYIPRILIEACMKEEIPNIRFALKDEFMHYPEHIRVAEVNDFCERELKPRLLELDPNLRSFIGVDFARSGDLSVFWPGQVRKDLSLKVAFGLELKNIPFEQQKQILFYICDRLPRFSGGKFDARGNGQYLAEVAVQRYGEDRIEAVMLSRGWYMQHFPKYKARFEDGEIEIPKDADILDDHRIVIVDKGVPVIPDKRTKGEKGEQRHGDTAIAGCLLNAATENDYIEFEYETVSRRDSYYFARKKGAY